MNIYTQIEYKLSTQLKGREQNKQYMMIQGEESQMNTEKGQEEEKSKAEQKTKREEHVPFDFEADKTKENPI